ncbi:MULTISPECIES: hypothetical protein [Bacillus cereus group]|uniref:hypothetical protein n=1 Tax=Bacillus cereus group TaxID=86661 RepID=UPI00027987C9|nr:MULTISPECIES: hypothetical protein [Bacillus cereus group]EJS16929.1 hypothetical protein IKS_00028 [Bacillus cereus VDM062]EJS52247.1 hypothetical protein ICG_04193 [Bacillus cereus BAG1X1-3]MBR3336846.1 hypothetical protein [Bacillus sp. (in: firmicutes)]MCX3320956.1 hypothetical protein [Bacillus paranthracis]MDA2301838.1 hypothetical protein [Bacillus cereus]HDR7673287.1 hypothetical protein [Bacillus wiedmannii]
MKTNYISQLSKETQELILNDLKNELAKLGLNKEEFLEAIDNAMNSRLCDLEDTINVNKYL